MSKRSETSETTSQCAIQNVSISLPNDIYLGALANLLKYSNKYEISIQFWPEQTAVYIAKDGVDLQNYGGDFDFAISRSIEYLDRVTGNTVKPQTLEK